MPPLSIDQARRLLEFAGDVRLGGMFILSLTLGLRIGEASGLSWPDVDLDARTIKIRQQVQSLDNVLSIEPLKTANSRRTLSLPTIAVDALKARRKAQLEDRLRAGADWKRDADRLVFTTERGTMVRPGAVRNCSQRRSRRQTCAE